MQDGDIPLSDNNSSEDTPYGFFIYYFDEIEGHIPLFAYPPELMDKKHETQILSIHPIWWHQEKFLETNRFNTIDLELEGVIYSATLFLSQTRRPKKRFGMDSKKWQAERFVLIVRAPSEVSFIAQELIHELKDRIQLDIGENLTILVDSYLAKLENLETEGNMIEKIDNVREKLSAYCRSLIPKIPLSKLEQQLETSFQSVSPSTQIFQQRVSEESKKLRKLRFSIPIEKKSAVSKGIVDQISRIEQKRVKIHKVIQEDKTNRLIIKNLSSSTLKDVVLKIYQSQSYFGANTIIKKINDWAPNDEVSIELEIDEEHLATYFLRIEDEDGLIFLKRIIG
jgi:hypothetical protein